MGKLDEIEKSTMRYRKLILHDSLEELNDIITGYNNSFYPFIVGDNETVSEKKVDALISELIESLKRFYSASRRTLDEHYAEIYKAFLYCVIAGKKKADYKKIITSSRLIPTTTFKDIIDFAENIKSEECDSYDGFLKLEYERYRTGSHNYSFFWDSMSESLRELGFYFIKDLPNEVQIKLCLNYEEDNNGSYINKYFFDDAAGWIENDDDFERFRYKYELNYDLHRKRMNDAKRTLTENLLNDDREDKTGSTFFLNLRKVYGYGYETLNYGTDPVFSVKKFIENYKFFVRAFFNEDHFDLSHDITHMIDTFLYENGLSAFSFGDEYGLITYQLENAIKHVKAEVKRRREK